MFRWGTHAQNIHYWSTRSHASEEENRTKNRSENCKCNACILKAHSQSGGSIWASLECQCCFWIASVVPYYVSPSSYSKTALTLKEARIEPPLFECEWAFRIQQGFFQDFLLGPFLQRRLCLAEQLGWLHPPPPYWGGGGWQLYSINVVETECVKAGALRDTINWLKMANA
jgi:hypothetical protein